MTPTIAVINIATSVPAAELAPWVRAWQLQISRDLAPAWGTDARLSIVHPHVVPPRSAWWLVIADDSDQADALGYHDLTADGMPIGFVLARTTIAAGEKVSVTGSHELCELLVDPWIDRAVQRDNADGSVTFIAQEVCDPCALDDYGYLVDNVRVSDFVTPAWFGELEGPYDHTRDIAAPWQLAPGGYVGVFDVGAGHGWTFETGRLASSRRARTHSRRERRAIGRRHWVPSAPTRVAA